MNKITSFLSKNIEDIVSLDLRALAVFRITLGLILLIDMIDRLKDANIFYAINGVGVNGNSNSLFTDISFSLNNLNGDVKFQIAILLTGVLLSVLFIIGFKTRFTTILLWIVVVSIQNRNFLILQGGDDYMRVLLLWAMFLPIGCRFSYDYFRNKTRFKKLENKYISPVNIGLIFQVIFLYYFSALSKNDPIWNKDFTAIYYALSLDIFVTWFGRILLTFRDLLRPLTAFVYYLEYYVGLLLVQPIYNWVTRTLGIILILGLHFGIGSTLDVGPFPWIAMCGALALLPTQAIDFGINLLRNDKRINKLIAKLGSNHLWLTLLKYLPKENRSLKRENKYIFSKYKENVFILSTLILSVFTFAITFVSYIWNENNNGANITLPTQVRSVFNFIRMDQDWAMFAPYPFTEDGWYVILGHKKSGEIESLFGANEKTNFDKFPDNYSQDFKNERWRKLMTNLWYDRYTSKRTDLLNYMCDEWNHDPNKQDKLVSIDMFYMLDRTLPDFQKFNIEKTNLGSVTCQ